MLTRESFVGPWAGLPVPWTDADEFDEATYRLDIERCCRAGVPGVYTGGTTGEFYALEFDEFQAISRATVETCHEFNTPVMIGCTSTSTRGAARRAAFAKQIGADAVQVALPFWLELQDVEVLPFFIEVGRAASGLALSIYETTRTKKCLTLRQHQDIYAALPQYMMTKANVGTIGATVDGCKALSSFVNVFVGEPLWGELGPHGAIGACSSMVYWNPWVVLAAWRFLCERNWAALDKASHKIIEFHQFLAHAYQDRSLSDSADDRNVARATGFLTTSLRIRGPYASATESDVLLVRHWLQAHYPEMLEMKTTVVRPQLRPHFSAYART